MSYVTASERSTVVEFKKKVEKENKGSVPRYDTPTSWRVRGEQVNENKKKKNNTERGSFVRNIYDGMDIGMPRIIYDATQVYLHAAPSSLSRNTYILYIYICI